MKIEVHRNAPNTLCVVGDFSVDGQTWKSLELPLEFEGQENVPDKTCIPAGTYEVKNLFSEKHGCLMPHVMGVPDRTAIEIHAASEPANLLGCTAIGTHWVTQHPQSATDVVINGSQEAFREFDTIFENALAAGEQVFITYTNDF